MTFAMMIRSIYDQRHEGQKYLRLTPYKSGVLITHTMMIRSDHDLCPDDQEYQGLTYEDQKYLRLTL